MVTIITPMFKPITNNNPAHITYVYLSAREGGKSGSLKPIAVAKHIRIVLSLYKLRNWESLDLNGLIIRSQLIISMLVPTQISN